MLYRSSFDSEWIWPTVWPQMLKIGVSSTFTHSNQLKFTYLNPIKLRWEAFGSAFQLTHPAAFYAASVNRSLAGSFAYTWWFTRCPLRTFCLPNWFCCLLLESMSVYLINFEWIFMLNELKRGQCQHWMRKTLTANQTQVNNINKGTDYEIIQMSLWVIKHSSSLTRRL